MREILDRIIIGTSLLFSIILYIVSLNKDNKELKKAKEITDEKEKMADLAKKEYNASKDELQKVRKRTEEILKRREERNEEPKVSSDDIDDIFSNIIER